MSAKDEYKATKYGTVTIALPLFPRAAVFVHVNQLYALLLHENARCERSDTICLNPPCASSQLLLDVPASRLIPSRPASTHETLQIPQTSLSFPSFAHPHLAAATASIAGGLFA